MNTRFAALLMTAMTVLTVSGPVSADPFFRGGDWPAVREGRDRERLGFGRIAHGRAFDRSLLMSGGDWLRPATDARGICDVAGR